MSKGKQCSSSLLVVRGNLHRDGCSKAFQALSHDSYHGLLFLTFSVLDANPKKLLYTIANPARGLLNREKRTK